MTLFLKKIVVAFASAAFLVAFLGSLLGGLSLETVVLRALVAGTAFGLIWAFFTAVLSKIFGQ